MLKYLKDTSNKASRLEHTNNKALEDSDGDSGVSVLSLGEKSLCKKTFQIDDAA